VSGFLSLFGPTNIDGDDENIDTEGKEGLQLELELYETTERDVGVEMDWFNPVPWDGSKGVRVLVR
jgi:hypothetical protein